MTDQQIRSTARDIARSAYENVVGPHAQTHRKETP